MHVSSSKASLNVVFIHVRDIFMDVLDFLIDVLVDVPGNVDDVLNDVLSLELRTPVEYSYSTNDFGVLTPKILLVTMPDFSTNHHSSARSAILARVSSSCSSDLSYPIHHVKKKVKKMKSCQLSHHILCFVFLFMSS
jgi:hypothetical protein